MTLSLKLLEGRSKPGRQPRPAPDDRTLITMLPLQTHRDWVLGEQSVSASYRQAFARSERLILFCKTACGWGRRAIRKRIGISERQVNNFYQKMREWH